LIATGDEHPIVLFKTNIGHAGEYLDEILGRRDTELPAPLVMSDALSSNHVTERNIRVCLCNSHGRREFYDLRSMDPQVIDKIVKDYNQIFHHEKICQKENWNPAERLDYHIKHSLPVMGQIRSYCVWLINEDKRFEPNSSFGKAYNYLVNNWEGLTAFCRWEGAEIENNIMERTLRLIVLGRKNAYFYRTEAGAAISDTLTSLLTTCKLNKVNPLLYLTAIQRYQDLVKNHPEAWLPLNYQQNLA
jgi:hypothetical protein